MDEITTIAELEACLEASGTAPIVIFKHSTACPLSAGANTQVKTFLEQNPTGAPDFYLVKVIESRPVSNEIANRLGIQHRSPQLILVKEGKSAWTASHYGINVDAIKKALDEHTN